ncbi:CD1108 family mobile element protein [Gemmiger formicilis]|uniref:C40 family peptidase n=1 Tax=Gemmiger formicilis TaxID=745368 RepID=UPI003CCA6F2F
MKELKASDKVTQKMTHDGAVTENLATGEVTNISSRQPEADLSASSEESAGTAFDLAARVSEAHISHTERKEAKADREAVKEGSAARRRPSSRLQFTDEERADPALKKYIDRSDKAADKLDRAKAAIPTKKVLRRERIFDEAAGKGKTRLHFEEVEKKPNGKLHHNPLSRPVQELSATAHSKIRQVEHENVGVEAGHKGEVLAERGVSYTGSRVKTAYRHHKTKPWRDAAKAEQASVKANAEYLYQKALHDDPSLAAANPVSRFMQKQRIKRNYAKEVRQAGQNTKKAAATAKSAAIRAKEAAKRAAVFVKSNWKVILIVVAIAAVVFLLLGGISSCTMMLGSGAGTMFSSSYLSEDADIHGAENAYLAMEAELQNKLDNYETLNPGYDEYRYDLDDIEHDPYVLISILSALHEGTFTADQVQDDLAMLFEKQYILTETTQTETRYRTETRTGTRTVTDPETGETTTEEYEYEVQVPYTYYIRNVKLENFNLSHVPVYIMGEDTLSIYATYMSTLGNREDLFPSSSYVEKYTTPPATYDIPASALEDETFAAFITEAEKYIGYPYVWGGSNPNTSFDCSGFVSWALTESGVCNTGRLGAQGLYNISTPVSSANARPGDLIFFVGTYDTPGISHVGIYVGGGKMLHCGDPIQYADINTSYWQSHFYAFARPPYN